MPGNGLAVRMTKSLSFEADLNSEARDLAFGRKACIVLLGVNMLLAVAFLLGLTASAPVASWALWIILLEGLFAAVIFVPMLAYRMICKKEPVRLAASRALQSFVDALGIAPT